MIVNFDLSQEIFAVDMLRASKSSLKHRRKHVLRPLQLYGDQALNVDSIRRDYKLLAVGQEFVHNATCVKVT